MPTLQAPPPSPISFGTIKAVLREFDLDDTRPTDPGLLQALRLIYPRDRELAQRTRASALSLTDAATPDQQIRFFQHQRATRNFVKLAQWVVAERGPVSLTIEHASDIDIPSRAFLATAVAVCGWVVSYTDTRRRPALEWWSPDDDLDAVEPGPDELCAAAFDHVNVGDAWSAVRLGRQLSSIEQSPRVWNLLALGFAMLGETECAEYYYRRWAEDGGPLDVVRAEYGLAMLYARHHPAGLHDLGKAAALLEHASNVLSTMDQSAYPGEDLLFEEVFNSNGRALILFRDGDVDAALDLLRTGIARLEQADARIAIHRSVLIYNLAQCHRRLGAIDAAVETYRQLLTVDPNMAEYHLEAARCFAASGRTSESIAAARRALELDATLPSGWSFLGLYLAEIGDLDGAAAALAEASRLDPGRPTYALDQAYYLVLNGAERKAFAILRSIEPRSQQDVERHAGLLAEIMRRRGRPERALNCLAAALARFPDSENLRANHSKLVTA